MIVREAKPGFVLIKQHDHGLLSGEFARHLSSELTNGRPTGKVLDAIANHDRAWESPDSKVLWNEEKDRPYSFLDHPPEPKTSAYARFLDNMEARDPYSGLLCSAHYGSLVADSEDPYEQRFAAAEEGRRKRLRAELSSEDLEDFERDFAVLQFSDDFSLFVCLNEPGRSDHPWYRDGISFMGSKVVPEWKDERTLCPGAGVLVRNFDARLPYRVVDSDGVEVESGVYGFEVILQDP